MPLSSTLNGKAALPSLFVPAISTEEKRAENRVLGST